MKLFISNTIHKFKTQSIPTNSLILPLQKYKIAEAIDLITTLNPKKIICETEEIYNLLFKKFDNLEILNENTKCFHYINNNVIYQNIYYIIISSICAYIISKIFNIKFILLTLTINISIFLALTFIFKDNLKWDKKSSILVDF